MNCIIELEEKLTKAELTANEETLKNLLSEEFRGVNIRGERIDKKGFIAGVCKSGIKFNELKIENVDVLLKENYAIVTGRSVFELQIDENKLPGSAQFMDIWQLDETWQLIASTVTPER